MENKYEAIMDGLDSVVWYNGMGELFDELYGQVQWFSDDFFQRDDIDHYLSGDSQFGVIWMIMVSMFGDYGTSPRSGYLDMENKKEILEFIKRITQTYREADV